MGTDKYSGDEKTDKCWQIIHKSLTQINNLSVEMLAFASEQELLPTATDINRAILANTEFFTQSLGKKGMGTTFKMVFSTKSFYS